MIAITISYQFKYHNNYTIIPWLFRKYRFKFM